MKNLSLMTDFYQLSMMKGYLETVCMNDQVVFDLFLSCQPV
jgi:nicotinate phosphoribosyltransferase